MIQIGFIPNLNSGKYYTATYGAIYYQVNQTTTTLLEKIIMVVYEFIYGKSILLKFLTPFLAANKKRRKYVLKS